MRIALFSLFIIVFNTFGLTQVKLYVEGGVSINANYRNLNFITLDGSSTKQYLTYRRKVENIAIREGLDFNFGIQLLENLYVSTGLRYQRMGDREEINLLAYVEEEEMYRMLPFKIRHNYSYFGIPLNFDYYIATFKNTLIGFRYHIGFDYLTKISNTVRTKHELFKPPLGYTTFFSTERAFVLNSGLGILTKTEISKDLYFKLNILSNYHLNPSFVRESQVNQHNFSIGLNVGLLKYF